jgi:pilus assembly protein CpaB
MPYELGGGRYSPVHLGIISFIHKIVGGIQKMKARGGRFLLILGAGLAVMSFVVVYILMSKGSLVGSSQAASQVPVAPPTKQIVVVSRDVPAYTVLDASNVTTKDVDASAVVTGTNSDPAAVFGKMTLVSISNGQQVPDDKLTKAGFSNILAPGEKAFTLAVPPSDTFGNTLSEGDHIDVLWSAGVELKSLSTDPNSQKDLVITSTKALLQDVKILRVIPLSSPQPAKPGANNGTDGAQPAALVRPSDTAAMYSAGADYSEVLVLGVTDQQAEVLKFARENGSITLTLRSSAATKGADGKDVLGDHEVEKTTGITLKTLIDQYGLPLSLPKTTDIK